MVDIWIPWAERWDAPTQYWGTYTDGPPKGVLHTVQAKAFPPRKTDYYGHTGWAHGTIGMRGGTGHTMQHIPLNRAARALVNKSGGVQTNNDTAVQFEIAWMAEDAKNMPRALLDEIARVMRFVEEHCGVQRVAAVFLPSKNAGAARMTPDAWDAFNGWCGHQHVPENDHVDPGDIDIAYLLGTAPVPPPDQEDEPMPVFVTTTDDDPVQDWYVTDGLTKRVLAPGENQLLVDLGVVKAGPNGKPTVKNVSAAALARIPTIR